MRQSVRVVLAALGISAAPYGAASLTGVWLGESLPHPRGTWRLAGDIHLEPGINDDVGLAGQEISDAHPPNPPISLHATEATRIPVRIRREDPLRLHRRGRPPSPSHDASAHAPPRAPNCDHKSDDPGDDDCSRAPRPSEPGEVARRDEPKAPEEEQDQAEDGEGKAGRTAHGEMVSRRLDSPSKHYTRNGAAGMWAKRSACVSPEVDGIAFRQSGETLGIAEFEAVQRVLCHGGSGRHEQHEVRIQESSEHGRLDGSTCPLGERR